MNTNYIIFMVLFSTAFFYKACFWAYVIQLKEYRYDRFTEYKRTTQGKNAIFNFWFILEIFMLLICFSLFIDNKLEIMLAPIFFVYLILENIFVFGKLIRRNILKPKNTSRMLLTFLVFFILYCSIVIFQLFIPITPLIYISIFIALLAVPLLLFLSIFCTLPIVTFLKRKKIKTAQEKSKSLPAITKIGITGSFGKSSVKTYLAQILGSHKNTLSTPENINSELGVADIVIKQLTNEYEYFVAEMGAYKRGEISILGNIVNHKHAFLTGIGNQHLALFGSLENTKKGKFEIYEQVKKNGGKIYINNDNPYIQEYLENNSFCEGSVVRYGILNKSSDAKSQIQTLENGVTKFIFYYKEEKYDFETKLIGAHNILNLTGILAFCFDTGMAYDDIKKGLLHVNAPKNTLEIHRVGETHVIDDSYNLSEDGLLAGIDAASSFGKEKKIYLVLDDILELGKEAEMKHKEIIKKIAMHYPIEKIYFAGKNHKKQILEGLKDAGKENLLAKTFDFKENRDLVYLFEGKGANRYFSKVIQLGS